MLVKAKWNVKDADGWHKAGEVWDAKDDLGDCVEILEKPMTEQKAEQQPEVKTKSVGRKRTSK